MGIFDRFLPGTSPPTYKSPALELDEVVGVDEGDAPRIAIVGCGAVTELFHLPALKRLGKRPSVLADVNKGRAERLAADFGVAHVVTKASDTGELADAAIVAVPPTLHASVTCELLRLGLHILVEKPMATTPSDCDEMIRTASFNDRVLTVGLVRRHLVANTWLKMLIDSDILGRISSFDVREGVVFGWPVTSPAFFSTEQGGGGVLADTGAHTLDLVNWLFGDAAQYEYFDDSQGGVEADCLMHLEMRSGSSGTVELSRTRNLRNSIVVKGGNGTVEVDLSGREINAQPPKWLKLELGRLRGDHLPIQSLDDLFTLQLRNWIDAIVGASSLVVDAVEAARSVELISSCYESRKQLVYPWDDPEASRRELGTDSA